MLVDLGENEEVVSDPALEIELEESGFGRL